MTQETKQALRDFRLRLLDKAEKEMEHSKTIIPGVPRREQQRGIALGLERAAKMIEQDLIIAP